VAKTLPARFTYDPPREHTHASFYSPSQFHFLVSQRKSKARAIIDPKP